MLDGKKVLIVEDEAQMIESFKYKFKYKPVVKSVIPLYAKNIVEAENIITTENPDLIFLDLSLADSNPPDGFEILKKFAKSHNIIVVSGYVKYEEECLALGAKGYMVKNNIEFIQMMELGENVLNSLVK